MEHEAVSGLMQFGALGIVCAVLLGLVVWLVHFMATRLEVAIRENTHAVKNMAMAYVSAEKAYESGGGERGSKAY